MALINPFRKRASDVVDVRQVARWQRRNSGLEVPRDKDDVAAEERRARDVEAARETTRRRLGRDLTAAELTLVERLGRPLKRKDRRDVLKPYVARYVTGSPRRAFKGIATPREVLRTMGTMPAPAPVPGRGGRCTDEAKRKARGWGPASEAPLIRSSIAQTLATFDAAGIPAEAFGITPERRAELLEGAWPDDGKAA